MESTENKMRLRWTSHQGTIISLVETLLHSKSLVDVTLSCEGKFLQAHRLILSASSPYFEELFSLETTKTPIVFLKGVKFSELKALIDYIYRGEVHVSQHELLSLMQLANELKIRGLGDVESGSELSLPSFQNPVTDGTENYLSSSQGKGTSPSQPVEILRRNVGVVNDLNSNAGNNLSSQSVLNQQRTHYNHNLVKNIPPQQPPNSLSPPQASSVFCTEGVNTTTKPPFPSHTRLLPKRRKSFDIVSHKASYNRSHSSSDQQYSTFDDNQDDRVQIFPIPPLENSISNSTKIHNLTSANDATIPEKNHQSFRIMPMTASEARNGFELKAQSLLAEFEAQSQAILNRASAKKNESKECENENSEYFDEFDELRARIKDGTINPALSGMSIEGVDGTHTCMLCGRILRNKMCHTSHIYYDCPSVPPRFQCPICHHPYRRKIQMLKHIRQAHEFSGVLD